jgi:hypothetical protein
VRHRRHSQEDYRKRFDYDRQWEVLAAEILSGMKEWRLQHPRATLNEIEAALDEWLSWLRARMLEDATLASSAADLSEDREGPPLCPQCGQLMERYGGAPVRNLQTQGGQRLELERQYARCPSCGTEPFPPG